jgi:hypothetical protein
MRLHVPRSDARRNALFTGIESAGVIDLDTGNVVGSISISQGMWIGGTRSHTRHISLFGGKYAGSFDRHDECVAFAKGVEAVLNHLVSTGEQLSKQNRTTAA